MAQTQILATGQTAGTSSDVTIPQGGNATFSIRSTTAGKSIPGNISLPIVLVVDGTEQTKASLSAIYSSQNIVGAGVWRVKREDITAYGVDIKVLVDQ